MICFASIFRHAQLLALDYVTLMDIVLTTSQVELPTAIAMKDILEMRAQKNSAPKGVTMVIPFSSDL
jgi:hypothetical protein